MPVDTQNIIPFITDWTKVTETPNAKWPQWFKERREQSLNRFADIGVPTTKDEEWKYTNIVPATQQKYNLMAKGIDLKNEKFKHYFSAQDLNIVFTNGVFSPELSNLKSLPKGLSISSLFQAIEKSDSNIKKLLDHYEPVKASAFVALNQALSQEGLYLHVDSNTKIDQLIHIIHVTNAVDPIFTVPHSVIILDKSAEATVLESYICFNDQLKYFTNALTDIYIPENSTLHYCKAQSESLKAVHVGATRVWQERSSNLDAFTIDVGGELTRNNLDVALDGEGSGAILNGLYSLNGKQLVDNHSTVEHRVPSCTSNQLYKGLLNGASHAVFNGKIFVRSIAQLTNSYQLNKNLIIGHDCRVETKPQLEIFADDVKCTHGATIGQLNEDEIFYLQTRSIPKKRAINMLSRGFVDDILLTFTNEAIRSKLNIILEPTFAALE